MIDTAASCSHSRAKKLYIDSIRHQNTPGYFESTKCLSYEKYQNFKCENNQKVLMGEKASDFAMDLVGGKPKKFFLNTKESAPFSITTYD